VRSSFLSNFSSVFSFCRHLVSRRNINRQQ
jgi:hypothetical protein